MEQNPKPIDTSCAGIFRQASPMDAGGAPKQAAPDLTIEDMALHILMDYRHKVDTAREHYKYIQQRREVDPVGVEKARVDMESASLDTAYAERIWDELKSLNAKVRFYEERFGKAE